MSDNPDDYYVDLLDYFVNVQSARAYMHELREEFPDGDIFCGSFVTECTDDLTELKNKQEDIMNTYKVIRVLNTIIDTIYEAIDVLIADHDIDIEEDVENE